MIARSLRRASEWRSSFVTLDHIVEVEFREAFHPDREGGSPIELSTYEVAADELAQISAEHAASVPLRLDKMTWLSADSALDLDGLQVRATPVPTEFEFMRQRHRDVIVRDIAMLRELAARLRGPDGSASPVHVVEKARIVNYVSDRLKRGDNAWLKAMPSTWRIAGHGGAAMPQAADAPARSARPGESP